MQSVLERFQVTGIAFSSKLQRLLLQKVYDQALRFPAKLA